MIAPWLFWLVFIGWVITFACLLAEHDRRMTLERRITKLNEYARERTRGHLQRVV